MKLKIGKAKEKKKSAPEKAKIQLPKLRKTRITTEHQYMDGDTFMCRDCRKEHILFECTNIDHPYLFYYCRNQMKLGVLGQWAYI